MPIVQYNVGEIKPLRALLMCRGRGPKSGFVVYWGGFYFQMNPLLVDRVMKTI